MEKPYWTAERQKRQDARVKQMDNGDIQSTDFTSKELREKFA